MNTTPGFLEPICVRIGFQLDAIIMTVLPVRAAMLAHLGQRGNVMLV
jgi:hypothetical protein